jgi:preprotein translocase subunit SecG
MMYPIILGIHVFVCILLIISILLQSGKGSDLGSAFGAGSGSDVLGAATPANVMNKITTILVIVFMFTSITLTVLSGNRTGNSITNKIPSVQQQAPTEQPKIPVK